MNMKMIIKIKNKKIKLLALVLLAGISLYFYLGSFFQSGVDYYGSFMQQESEVKGSALKYEGKTKYGQTEISLTTMMETDKLIELSLDGQSREYVMESSTDGQKIRLFDENNAMIFTGTLNREDGVITTSENEIISYYGYKPLSNHEYSEMNPDPILVVIMANRLNESYRGNLSMLIFTGIILLSLIIDIIFPKFFFRLKNLNFKDDIELPAMYVKMQKYSWMLSPVVIIIFLFMAI